ncbi:hypothetical protein QYF36_020407 [Acer negundo]|nr:hypothetical protein QYF36_020407 [Acer negundo]
MHGKNAQDNSELSAGIPPIFKESCAGSHMCTEMVVAQWESGGYVDIDGSGSSFGPKTRKWKRWARDDSKLDNGLGLEAQLGKRNLYIKKGRVVK